ncbi:MAG TPA: CHAT domain-containing protein [Chakrabartia sp.]|jgi:CHAT domain-containing protein|nr:CHAT domain-containing protein [Chakrabartia sp.]
MLRTILYKSLISLAALSAPLLASPAMAQMTRPLNADSFKLGSGGGAICQVQTRSRDSALASAFDRAWTIVCRDSARPVGRLYALRGDQAAAFARTADRRKEEAQCTDGVVQSVSGLSSGQSWACRLVDAQVGYKVITARKGNILFVSEGLAAYESALMLALRSVMEDRIVPGQINVATSAVDDPAAFARVQAGSLDADKALAEGYRRNNAGNYAEAAEFFDTLQQRMERQSGSRDLRTEYLVNQALQKSNLGDFAEADALFREVMASPTADRVQVRLRRNYAALHLLNQKRYDEALARIRQPVAPIPARAALPGSAIEIGAQVAAEINAGLPVNQRIGATDIASLTPDERARFLDAQALGIEGTVLRLTGQPAQGRARLETALADMLEIRNGRVISIIRMRSQVTAEIGLALEDEGNLSGAEGRLREAVSLLEVRYPETIAVNGARARLAAFLARHGQAQAALTEYRLVVGSAVANQAPTTGMGNLIAPYFDLLAGQGLANDANAAELLLATQTLVRPGVADTQAILARELSESGTEAARLFRQSRSLARDIERSRIDLATLVNQQNQTADIKQAIAAVQADIESLQKQQSATQALLGDYPQFRAIANRSVTSDELKGQLKPEEAYLKLTVAGSSVYGLLVDRNGATAWKLPLTPDGMQASVDQLRDSIAKDEGGQITTYAYDVDAARKLYLDLAGPVSDRLKQASHIIFEPDGAMLQLPLNLLIADDKGVEAYKARVLQSGADEFDFTGVNWLGRGRSISTAVSVRSFRDARTVPASKAGRQYVGFGRNLPINGTVLRLSAVRGAGSAQSLDCTWPASIWARPISEMELKEASQAIGAGTSEVIAGSGFTDSAIKARTDLTDFRIVHFATHGLVTAPRPECPARPALVTSFASDGESDGLLSFREIFDLKLDADLIILSACDTAGKASVAATREAGVTSGGGSALDGLVRAFIGAGGRSVIASHWPAPDDFNATQRLITGLFKAGSGASVGAALGKAQEALMDDPETSHPYYWAGFAIVGDSSRSLISAP